MSDNIISKIGRNAVNIPGWKTKRKIVVIESDDWGSIRMPSKEAYEKLLKQGIPVNKDYYCRYDSLASEDDLTAIFEVLTKFRDKNGNHPIITANTIVANPDFKKIRESEFSQYYFEPFTETLKRYPRCENSFEIWKSGIDQKIFFPQFHGREHLNIKLWMESLKRKDSAIMAAFKEEVFGIPVSNGQNNRENYMAAFDSIDKDHHQEIKQIVAEGLKMFEEIFKYESRTIMAPCYLWSKSIEKELSENHVTGLQGMIYQLIPSSEIKILKKIFHYCGQQNSFKQRYLVRNAFFEPSHYPNINYVKDILERMEISFFWNKPVIISTHRLNFIGSIVERNRENNLLKFEELLKAIVLKWPEIEFMTSPELISAMG